MTVKWKHHNGSVIFQDSDFSSLATQLTALCFEVLLGDRQKTEFRQICSAMPGSVYCLGSKLAALIINALDCGFIE